MKSDRSRKFAARMAVAELVRIAQAAAAKPECKETAKQLAAARSKVMAFIHPEAH